MECNNIPSADVLMMCKRYWVANISFVTKPLRPSTYCHLSSMCNIFLKPWRGCVAHWFDQSMFWRMFLVPAWLVDSGGESEFGLPLAEFPMLLGLRLTGFTFNGCQKDHWTNRSFVLGPIQRTSKNRSGNFCQASMNINLNTLGRWQSWHHQQLWLQLHQTCDSGNMVFVRTNSIVEFAAFFFRITASYQTGHSIGV